MRPRRCGGASSLLSLLSTEATDSGVARAAVIGVGMWEDRLEGQDHRSWVR